MRQRRQMMAGLMVAFSLCLTSAAMAQGEVIELEEEELEVTLETPEANYILNASIPAYELRPPVASFLDELEESVRTRLFQ